MKYLLTVLLLWSVAYGQNIRVPKQPRSDSSMLIANTAFVKDFAAPNDSTTPLTLSPATLRAKHGILANRVVWINQGRQEGFFKRATGSAPDDSVLNLRDGDNNLYRRVTGGQYRADWWLTSGTDVTTRLQQMMNVLPDSADLYIQDSAVYYVSAMITRSRPLNVYCSKKVTFKQLTPYTSMFYYNGLQGGFNWTGGTIQQTGFGDENDFPRGYGSAFVFQDVQGTCIVTKTKIFNCGDYLHQGIPSPRSATGQPYEGSGKLTSSAGVYATRSGFIRVYENEISFCITAFNSDGYQNKAIGTPGHMVITDNYICDNIITDCTQDIVIDGLDSSGLADAFPGWIMRNTCTKSAFFTSQGVPNTSAIKIFTNLATKGVIVQYNHLKGRFGVGISIQTGCYNADIGYNDIDSAFTAIAVIVGGRVVRYLNIHDNHFTASAAQDISMIGAQQSIIVNNTSLNSRGYGIVQDGYSTDIKMLNNNMTNLAKNGILLKTGSGYFIQGGSIIGSCYDGLTDSAAISINPAMATGVLWGVTVDHVTFDVPSTAGAPTLISKYSVYAHGQYSASNSFIRAGEVKDNIFGRTIGADDQTEHTFGLAWRHNQGPNAYDTLGGNVVRFIWDQNSYGQILNSSTGAMSWTATGSSPALTMNFPTTTTGAAVASGGLAANATRENGNFWYSGSTGVGTTTNPRYLIANQQLTAVRSALGSGSTGTTLTGTFPSFGAIIPSTDYTLNGTNPWAGGLVIKAQNFIAGTGTLNVGASLMLAGRGANATINTALGIDSGAVWLNRTLPYRAVDASRVVVLGPDSLLYQTDAPTSASYANPTGTVGTTATNGSATTAMRSDAAPAINQAMVPTWTGVHNFAPVSSISTGGANGLNLFPQFTQSGTSTYNGLYMSLYDNGTNSGNKYLLNMGTNTAALNGGTYTSKFSVTTAGAATLSSSLTLGGGLSGTSATFSTTQTTTGTATFNGGTVVNGSQTVKRTTVADAAYTILGTDYIIAYTTLTATRAVTLPTSHVTGKVFIVKDESGNAGSFSITIVGTVDGATNKSVSNAYGAMRIYDNGTNYFTF